MFVTKDVCLNCRHTVEVNIDTSEGVPSRVGVECDHCGAINHFVLSWAPRVWVTDRAGFDVPAVTQSNKGLHPTAAGVESAGENSESGGG